MQITDKQRLSFLGNRKFSVIHFYDDDEYLFKTYSLSLIVGNKNFKGKTLEEAIDAAIMAMEEAMEITES